MAVEFEGKPVETSDSGYLADIDTWNTGLAQILASRESIELTERHWDVINFLRGEYFENNQTQPNTRAIVKAMSAQWGEKISQKDLYMKSRKKTCTCCSRAILRNRAAKSRASPKADVRAGIETGAGGMLQRSYIDLRDQSHIAE